MGIAELEFGYRVPRPAFELAARVLGDAAPGVRMPQVVREGPNPRLVETDVSDRASATVAAARSFAGDGHLVGVICVDGLRTATLDAFRSEQVRVSEARQEGLAGTISLVSPTEAKGLEFDAVVVVEPAAIAAEDEHGRRQLYIAFTRTTAHLAVVHSEKFLPEEESAEGALPSEDGLPGDQRVEKTSLEPEGEETSGRTSQDAAVRAIARHFVEEIRGVVRDDQVDAVLAAIREELTGGEGT